MEGSTDERTILNPKLLHSFYLVRIPNERAFSKGKIGTIWQQATHPCGAPSNIKKVGTALYQRRVVIGVHPEHHSTDEDP